jgi:hypothetical protein
MAVDYSVHQQAGVWQGEGWAGLTMYFLGDKGHGGGCLGGGFVSALLGRIFVEG